VSTLSNFRAADEELPQNFRSEPELRLRVTQDTGCRRESKSENACEEPGSLMPFFGPQRLSKASEEHDDVTSQTGFSYHHYRRRSHDLDCFWRCHLAICGANQNGNIIREYFTTRHAPHTSGATSLRRSRLGWRISFLIPTRCRCGGTIISALLNSKAIEQAASCRRASRTVARKRRPLARQPRHNR
jgi:hypothetical protein